MSVLLYVENLTVCDFNHFLTLVLYGHLFCGGLLSHKMSEELHENKEEEKKRIGTVSIAAGSMYLPQSCNTHQDMLVS